MGLVCCTTRDGERRRTGEVELRLLPPFDAGDGGGEEVRLGDCDGEAAAFVGDLRVGGEVEVCFVEEAEVCFVEVFGGDFGT